MTLGFYIFKRRPLLTLPGFARHNSTKPKQSSSFQGHCPDSTKITDNVKASQAIVVQLVYLWVHQELGSQATTCCYWCLCQVCDDNRDQPQISMVDSIHILLYQESSSCFLCVYLLSSSSLVYPSRKANMLVQYSTQYQSVQKLSTEVIQSHLF